jgi:uncharacterized protein (TIGR03790 family)
MASFIKNSQHHHEFISTVLCWSALLSITIAFSSSSFAESINTLYKPLLALSAKNLGVIVNDADPMSLQISQYYQQQRKIPQENIVHIHFKPHQKILDVVKFKSIKQKIDRQMPRHVQALALTWTQPYRVGCMSITTAFAAGFNKSFCATGCQKTQPSSYFNSQSSQPFSDHQLRPTMALAGNTFVEVKSLIDRGIASDYSHPLGTAYLLKTSDTTRSSRSVYHPLMDKNFKGLWKTEILEQDTIENKSDVMFYFTGKERVEKIMTNQFLPGAVADHLTSAGGILINSPQMSSLEWLKAGATGSYGAVTEPCNYVQKFPNPGIMMHFYLKGNSLIEAYWKSVAWPGQGIFIGEPLAKPFAYEPLSL